MSINKLNTIHHVRELERTQLLTILALCVENPQFAGYLLTETVVLFSKYKALLFGYMTIFSFIHPCVKLIFVLILYQYANEVLLCTFI